MTKALFILLMAIAGNSVAQITVDTTKTMVTVKDKTPPGIKTLTIYRSFVQGLGMRNQAVYQPSAAEFGEEEPTLALNFTTELPRIKKLLDAAVKMKQFNFSQISLNILPYTDLINKLVETYSGSKEWNDYLAKAGDLKRTTTLFDGSEIAEIAYDTKVAGSVLDKSDFLKGVSDFFAAYGYKVSSGGFPDDHLLTVSPEKLVALGKKSAYVVPIPNTFFVLSKIK